MLLRSGFIMRSGTQDTDEDSSTRAEWGTPSQHTSSFSGNDNRHTLGSIEEDNPSTVLQQAGQQPYNHSLIATSDFILFPSANDGAHTDSLQSDEQIVRTHSPDSLHSNPQQQDRQEYASHLLARSHPLVSNPGFAQESEPSTPMPIATQLQTPGPTPHSHESIQRYVHSDDAWSPTSKIDPESRKKIITEQMPDVKGYPNDRNYPDKMENHLKRLENGDEELSEEERRNKKKVRRGKGKSIAEPPSKGYRGRRDRDYGGEGGQGSGEALRTT